MFVLDILSHLHILRPEWKRTMTDEGAVANSLNGDKRFWSSAYKNTVIASGLPEASRFAIRRKNHVGQRI